MIVKLEDYLPAWMAGAAVSINRARAEWNVMPRDWFALLGVGVDAAESEAKASIAVPFLGSLHVSARVPRGIAELIARRLSGNSMDSVDIVRVSAHDGSLFWSIGTSSMKWSSDTPRWRSGSLDVVTALLGAQEQEVVDQKNLSATISMPEADYRWAIRMRATRVKRKRWPFPRVLHGWDASPIECGDRDNSIPIPGKGSTAYNCGPDALRGCSGLGGSAADAVSSIVRIVVKKRIERCGNMAYSERPQPRAAA